MALHTYNTADVSLQFINTRPQIITQCDPNLPRILLLKLAEDEGIDSEQSDQRPKKAKVNKNTSQKHGATQNVEEPRNQSRSQIRQRTLLKEIWRLQRK